MKLSKDVDYDTLQPAFYLQIRNNNYFSLYYLVNLEGNIKRLIIRLDSNFLTAQRLKIAFNYIKEKSFHSHRSNLKDISYYFYDNRLSPHNTTMYHICDNINTYNKFISAYPEIMV